MNLWRRIYVERRGVALPLLLALVANVAVLVLVVAPLAKIVSSLEDEATNTTFVLRKAQLAERQAKDARASKDRADVELKKFYSSVLPADAIAARKLVALSFLDHAARDAGLTYQRSSADQTDIKDSQLERVTAKVTLVGDYASIRKFLYAVETAEEFVVIERVAVSQAADLHANTGALEVTLDVATYYRPAAAPGAQ
jgi:Tfp pilus assembly protein PilO